MAERTLPTAEPALFDPGQLRIDLAMRRAGKVLLALIPWAGYLFLWLPIAVLIVFSFNSSRTNAVWQDFTLDWYRILLSGQFGTEPRLSTDFLLQALKNSLYVAVIATVIA